jgi:Tfp pilus assembly protein PilN
MSSEEKRQILESVRHEIQEDEGKDNEVRLSYFVIGIFAGILLVLIFSMAWQKSKQYKIDSLNQKVADLNNQLKSLEGQEDQSDTLLQQIDIFTSALSGRVKQSQFLGDLRSYQYKKSRWTGLNFSKNTVVINAQVDNFDDMAKAVVAMRSLKAAKDVEVTAVNINQESKKVEFIMTITLDTVLYQYLPQSTQTKTTTSQ